MPDLVLIQPPLTAAQRYGEFADVGNNLPNLGLANLAAYAREQGISVAIIDAPAMGYDVRRTVREVVAMQPKVAGITSVTLSIVAASECAKGIKQAMPHVVTLVGGAHVTALPDETMTTYDAFDIGVVGEGERTLVELWSALNGDGSIEAIDGIVLRNGGKIERTAPRELIRDLDVLPMPAWDLLPDLAKTYRPSPQSTFRLPSTILFTTRGCPFRCSFCDRSVFGQRVRPHSAQRVVEMFRHLHDRYGIVDFAIHDESFIFNRRRLEAICEGLLRDDLDVSWVCQGRVDQPLPLETLRLMKRAGCRQLQFGIETADQRLLDILQKGTTIENAVSGLARTKAAGLSTKAFLMAGVPGETAESLAALERFTLTAPLDDIMVSYFTPFPGCELYDEIDKYGKLVGGYDAMSEYRVVFVPDGLTAEEIETARRRIYRRFYLRPRIVTNYARRTLAGNAAPFIVRSALSSMKMFFGK